MKGERKRLLAATIVVVCGLSLVLGGCSRDSLLQKDMRFKLLAVMDGLQAAAQSLGVVTFAALGFGYWSLVLGGLLGAIVSTAMPLAWRPHGFAWPRFGSIRHALTFSWRIIVTRLSWHGYSNADFLVAGRVLGEAALGA